MRRFTKWLCLLLLSTALLMPHYANAARGIAVKPVSPSGAKAKGNQWLFVIGIDTYIHWPRLNTAVNDAKSVRDVLLSRYHFDKDHLIELYDEQATRRNILSRLRFLAKKARKDDSLVIFYAGHGHLDSITKAGSWIPVGSGVEDTSAWITNHDIKNYLRVDAIKAKHILLISDSCFSGNFFRGHRGKLPEVTDTVIKKAYKLTSRQAITSGGLEPVGDEGFGKNSVFSHFLVKTLKENQKPFLVPSSFFPDIKAGVAENAEQFPRFGALKNTGGQQGGEIILFLKQDSRLKDLSVEAAKRQKELQRLKEMEVATEKARKKESAEIVKQEKELAELDAKIATMRKRLNTPSAQGGDDLDAMVVMVSQKEQQQKPIDDLKRQREAEEARRRAEIERLKAEKRGKLVAVIKEDIRKYKKIISSPFGKDMKESAWESLVAKYPEAADGLEIGDTDGLLFKVVPCSIVNSIGMKFVLIPTGSFMMGSPSDEQGRGSDKQQHKVTLTKAFYMGATEVTQGQWRAVMGNNPSNFKGDNRPVEEISWSSAKTFIRKLNQKEGTNKYRLPTEAEWEYACRAGSKSRFCFGDSNSRLGDYAWYRNNSSLKTHSVAQKKPNAWGLYDMHGNVDEWCEDWYEGYSDRHVTDPKGPSSGSLRVLRGGSWFFNARHVRSANRYGYNPGIGYNYLGFRVVRAY
jgi:formylglycine-generating enzyme required for sulfatase activity